jgi:predicted outer membrane repeat protein
MGRVIFCLGVDDAASIVGFTITGGLATGAAGRDSVGGGIYCEDSSPTLASCAFLDNSSTLVAGGLFCGVEAISAFTYRTLSHDPDPPPPVRSGPTVTDCTFSGNGSQGGGGAFIYQGSPTLTRCTFSGNTAERGGGIYCAGDDASLLDCTFFGNHADNSAGGAYFSAWSSATVTDCAFLHNTSAEHGGAVLSEQYSSPTFTGVTFTRNVAVWSGGAVLCENGSPSFDHVEFRTNTAGGAGGGIRFSGSASATLTNATFYDNVSAHGSGLYCSDSSSATLANCIIAFGGDATSAFQCGGTAGATLSCSNVYGNGGGDWVDCIAGQGTVNDNFSADPLFCRAENGDLTLHESSPCAPGNHPDGSSCGLIGAWDIGCWATGAAGSARERSWGAIKAMYR